MQKLSYTKSLLVDYSDPGIEISYVDLDNGPSIITLNDANNWASSLTDGSSLSISVERDSVPVIIDQGDSGTWVDMGTVGKYIISFSFSDDSGGTNVVTREVTITENEIPVINILGDNPQHVPLGDDYEESGVVVIDEDSPSVIESNIVIDDSGVDTGAIGSQSVSYDYTDTSGLVAQTESRDVEIFNNTGPIITLDGDSPLTIIIGTKFIEPGYIAVDALGNVLTDSVIISSDIKENLPGNYIIKYAVIDRFGASAWASRDVIVADYPDLDDVEVSGKENANLGNEVFRTETGISATYTKDMSISNFTEIGDVDNVIQNIYNIIFQSPRDRLFNPVFGSRIDIEVFELMESHNEEDVLNMLKEDIEKYEPRAEVVIAQSYVNMDAHLRSMQIALKVRVPGSGKLQTVAISIGN